MVEKEDTVYKVVLVGEGGVGKTSLVNRFVHKRFDDKYQKTLGTNVYKKDVEIKVGLKKKTVVLQIWDLLGQRAFQSIIRSAFRGARGVMMVCDITNLESIKNLETWIDMSFKNAPSSSFVFIANKSDLPNWQFGYKELKQFATLFESPFLLTSAKTGDNVNAAFTSIAKSIDSGGFVPKEYEKIVQSKEIVVKPLIKAEDDIIMQFCEVAGGHEISMPYIREQFHNHGIDFENPTKEDLLKVITSLVDTIRFIKGEKEAQILEKNLVDIVVKRGIF
jgi:Ras-related protein Rab-7A